MAQLTAEQKKGYLESPYHCPFCGSGEIDAGERDNQENGAFQNVRCLSCDKTWTDIYTLTKVLTDDD